MAQDAHTRLWELIKDIKFGMFTHRHGDGRLHSHPLTTQNKSIDDKGVLYFFVSRASELAERVRGDAMVNVAYADTGKDAYISVTGRAKAVDDRATTERLWSKLNEAWFPGGPTDPDLQLIEVVIEEAEYWDVKENKLVQLLKMAKAAVTGEPPKKLGEHKVL